MSQVLTMPQTDRDVFHVGAALGCDLSTLVDTRLLIQANSGGGKSWCLRRLLEQTHGRVQQLVIDPEGEFASLREKFDYVHAARQGADTAADPRSAKLLAERLLELGVSAILDIYELKAHERVRFVRFFLEALVDAPKSLWHPALIIVDEAHVFCPQQGEAESAGPVIDLATRGRKRGFCAVLATQRLSKLHKDAAAECNNKLVGRTSLDVDMKRAADELGFTGRDQTNGLRELGAGEFFAFGPAFTGTGVRRVTVGAVQTTHPKAGGRLAFAAPPPTAKVRALLPKLADLPAEAEARERTVEDLKREVAGLKRELTAAQKAAPVSQDVPVLTDADRRQLADLADALRGLPAVAGQETHFLDRVGSSVANAINGVVAEWRLDTENRRRSFEERFLKSDFGKLISKIAGAAPAPRPTAAPARPIPVSTAPRVSRSASPGKTGSADAAVGTGGLRRMLVALAQRPQGLSVRQIGVRATLSSKGGTFGTYLSRARTSGWVEGTPALLRITDAGLAALGEYEPLPTGRALFEHWLGELGNSGAARILEVLVDAYPRALSKAEVGERTSIAVGGGTFGTYLSRLRTLELIEGKSELRASAELFG